jgi:hypothetical protein
MGACLSAPLPPEQQQGGADWLPAAARDQGGPAGAAPRERHDTAAAGRQTVPHGDAARPLPGKAAPPPAAPPEDAPRGGRAEASPPSAGDQHGPAQAAAAAPAPQPKACRMQVLTKVRPPARAAPAAAGPQCPRTKRSPPPPPRTPPPPPPAAPQVQAMQQQLALCNSHPVLGLMEAAELLAVALDVGLVTVVGFAPQAGDDPAAPSPAALLACYGVGAPIVERHPVMAGPDWSHAQLLQAAGGADSGNAGPCILYHRGRSSQVRAPPGAGARSFGGDGPAVSRRAWQRWAPLTRPRAQRCAPAAAGRRRRGRAPRLAHAETGREAARLCHHPDRAAELARGRAERCA